jgi:6-phosphogluconolactonase
MTMRVQTVLMLMVALAMMGLASCDHYNCNNGPNLGATSCSGTTTTTTGSTSSAYAFAVDEDGTIDGFTLDTAAGTFAASTGYTGPSTPLNTPGQGMVVAQSQYLYALYTGTGQIFGFTISSTGSLTAISGSPFSASYLIASTVGGRQSMITNPGGTLLFVLDQSASEVYVYQIGTGGVLTLASSSPVTLPFEPENMGTDGLGNFLYITEIGTQVVPELAAYSINASNGSLTVVTGSPFSFGTYGLEQVVGDPSGKYLIGTEGEVTGNPALYVFSIAQAGAANAGAVTPVTGSPFLTATGFTPYTIAVQPSSGGDLVYSFSVSSSDAANPIEGYTLNTSTGALTPISGSPFSTLDTGTWGQFDQSGAYLFVYDSALTQVVPLEVGTGGVLTQPIPPVTTIDGFWAVTDPN